MSYIDICCLYIYIDVFIVHLYIWIYFLKQLYNELHICFETTKSSEAMLRQSVVTLQDQLFQKEQENAKLKEKLQQSQETLYPLPRECDSDRSEQVRGIF